MDEETSSGEYVWLAIIEPVGSVVELIDEDDFDGVCCSVNVISDDVCSIKVGLDELISSIGCWDELSVSRGWNEFSISGVFIISVDGEVDALVSNSSEL